jgi:hypothetical protein
MTSVARRMRATPGFGRGLIGFRASGGREDSFDASRVGMITYHISSTFPKSRYAYFGTRKRCGPCALKAQCTSGAFRFLAIHIDEPARQRARELATTPEFVHAQRQRKKVEALFAELKNQIGLRRLRLRRLKFVREQFFLAAGPEHQATRALPQPTDKTCSASHHLTELREEKLGRRLLAAEKTPYWRTFSTATRFFANYGCTDGLAVDFGVGTATRSPRYQQN